MNSQTCHRKLLRLLFATAGLGATALACASASDAPTRPDAIEADQVEVVKGVPDKDRDPAVVAIDIGEKALCTGALIAPDVVLTARHCVSQSVEEIACPAKGAQTKGTRSPASLKIILGDTIDATGAVAQGKEILEPRSTAICDEDIALIILDRPIEGVPTLAVRDTGVARGDHVRAIGYGRSGDDGPAGARLVREHVEVLETTAAEFVVGEATCQGDSGGPAIDEESGEIVGIVSRGGPSCNGPETHNIYTRTDAFLTLIDEALAKSGSPPDDPKGPAQSSAHRDAGRKPAHHGRGAAAAHKPKSDIGGACHAGSDCSAGSCVKEGTKEYCSRTCSSHDRCPARFACEKGRGGRSYCVER